MFLRYFVLTTCKGERKRDADAANTEHFCENPTFNTLWTTFKSPGGACRIKLLGLAPSLRGNLRLFQPASNPVLIINHLKPPSRDGETKFPKAVPRRVHIYRLVWPVIEGFI